MRIASAECQRSYRSFFYENCNPFQTLAPHERGRHMSEYIWRRDCWFHIDPLRRIPAPLRTKNCQNLNRSIRRAAAQSWTAQSALSNRFELHRRSISNRDGDSIESLSQRYESKETNLILHQAARLCPLHFGWSGLVGSDRVSCARRVIDNSRLHRFETGKGGRTSNGFTIAL